MEKWWNVDDDGVLTINAELYIKEKADGVLPTAGNKPWLKIYLRGYFTKIEFVGEGLEFPTYTGYWFYNYSNVTEIIGLELVSTSNVTDMSFMFEGMHSLTKLDTSSFDTRNVIVMKGMFHSMQSLTELDLSNFDTSNVTNMEYMFAYCEKITELDVSNFNTINVTNAYPQT
jgi:surface protein